MEIRRRGSMAQAGHRTGLMILLESPDDPAAGKHLRAALGACSVASMLIRPAQNPNPGTSALEPLIRTAQSAGAAALIEADARLGRALAADGVHVPRSNDLRDRYEDARVTLGRGAIVGVDAGTSRHDAMVLAEAGADYVAFGVAADADRARETRLDMVTWWAELFEVPCVAFDVEGPEEARMLADAGADFLAVRMSSGSSAEDTAARLRAIADAVAGGRGRP